MNQTKGKIAVTGASGQLGRRIVELLAEEVEPSRILALTRSPEKLADLAQRGLQVEFGDFSQPEELARTLGGVDRLLIISTDDMNGGRAGLHRNAVEAAVTAGVAHITYTSAPAPETSPLGFVREHADTEEAIRQSGLPYAILRNNFYTDMMLGSLPHWIERGEIRAAAADGKINRVTREDCARAAVAVLTTSGHDGVTYNITGPASLNGYELAEALSRVAGKAVRYTPISADEMRQDLLKAGFPALMADVFVEIDLAIAQGVFDVASSAVQDLTGHSPASVEEVFARQGEVLPASVDSTN